MRERTIEYYPTMDYDERTPPTEEEADLMCRTAGEMCPVAKECLALGKALRAPVGVWGGRVLVDGEDYYADKRKGVNNGSSNSKQEEV